MHKLFIILSCLIILTSCSSRNSKSVIDVGTVVIKGHIEMDESSAKVISLSYSCSTDRCDYGTAIVDSNGNFRFEFEVLHAQDVLLKYQKGFTKLFVQASDSLILTLNALDYKKERFPDYSIRGSNAHISKEILNYLRYRTIDDFSPALENKSVEGYLNDLRHQIFREDSVLAAYNKRYNPSSIFMLWAGKNIIYSNANYLSDFQFYHQVNKTTYEGKLFDKDLFPINDDDAIVSSWYDYHLKSYSYMGFQKDTLVKKLYNEEKYASAYRLVLSQIIENEESGISRDLMCYRLLSELLEKSFSEYLSLSDDVNKFLNNKELIALIDKRKAAFESRDNYNISRFDPDTQEEKEIIGDIFKDLADRHKDKVIYLDIWATWCGPCKNEIPYAIELHDFYKNEEIAFVNLCLSSDKNEWKETIKNYHIGGGNYYFDRTQSELLRNKLKFPGFPTYMIIDKNGNVVDADAPRPSSNEIIKEKLNKLLLE